jgi:ribosomal protein S27E
MRIAPCPSCGAQVEFHSAASVMAVCAYCRSTLVRHDTDLENLGTMATLAEDHSPFALRWRGQYRKVGFQLIGRLQLQYDAGYWNEWYAQFDDGRQGWVSEGSGLCYVTFEQALKAVLPPFEAFKPGMTAKLGDTVFTVSDIESATCVAIEGELPFRSAPGYAAPAVDLRADDRFASLDFSDTPPRAYLGEVVTLDALIDPSAPNAPAKAQRAQAHGFKCTSCGASITVSTPDTRVVGCGHCGAVVDVNDPDLKILSGALPTLAEPFLPIGGTGKLAGRQYAIIGYLKRGARYGETTYYWDEYLLHSEAGGYAWLIESNGHWSLGKPTSRQPVVRAAAKPVARLLDRNYLHYAHYPADVVRVIGEFNWRVAVGDTAQVNDYIAPPYMLSCEATDREVTWTLSEYLEPEQVRAAFKLSTPLPERIGIGANQPAPAFSSRPYWVAFAAFVLLALLIQTVVVARSDKRVVWQGDLTLDGSEAKKNLDAINLQLGGHTGNVRIEQQTNLDNRWLDTDLTLTNRDSGESFSLAREISYYHGVDDGESWSEGDNDDSALLNQVPPGNYILEMEAETSQDGNPAAVTDHVRLTRDVPLWGNFWLLLGVLAIPPIAMLLRRSQFESRRWADSDYASNSSEDDD